MKKILVPSDLSEIANNALDVAVAIAKKNNSKIELLNVKVYPTGDVGAYYSLYGATGVSIDNAWDNILAEAKIEMQDLIAKYPNVDIKPIIDETSEHFVNAVLDHKSDLIVMGSTGAEGLKEFFKGSNSEEIVRLAVCPVLVVKGALGALKPTKVVFAVDLTHEEFIKKAIKNLPLEDAECHFLHIDDGLRKLDYHEAQAKMQTIAEKNNLKNCKFEIYNSTTIENGILEYVEEVAADLIVMYTHGRTGINHFFKGSIAEDVVNHSKVSVFTFVED